MSILFDNIIFELQQAGGISTYWAELIKRFACEHPSHTFLEGSRAKKNKARSELSLPSELVENSVFVSRASRYFPVPIFCCHESRFFFSSYYRIPTCRKIKVIMTVYDFFYEKFVTGWRKDIHALQKKIAINRADAIVCISNSTKNDLLRFFPGVTESVHVILMGVSENFFQISDALLRKSLLSEIGIQPGYVLYVGSRAKYKNFSLVVQALRELPEIHLVCVGGGQFSDKEMSFLTENLANKFTHVSPNSLDLNVLYNNALCLLYPSSYEGFGIPLVEAMRAGCPIVASRTSSIPEVVGNAGMIMEKPSKEEIIESVKSLQSSSVRRDQVYKGIENSKRFSWENCYEEHRKLVQSLEG